MGHPARGVLVVDDSMVFAECLATGLRFVVCDEVQILCAPFGPRVASHIAATSHDAVVIGLEPGCDTELLGALLHNLRVDMHILSASHDSEFVEQCVELGAGGVFSKLRAFDELIWALGETLHGHTSMTERGRGRIMSRPSDLVTELLSSLSHSEHEVLAGLARGQQAKMIAQERSVSVHTVRAQIRSILVKLGVNSQLAAAAMANHNSRSGRTTRRG